ncbi:Transcriptional regulator, GntR family [hydrothermal vent metagenome]|uniref:Transcriptional regulator, GntR family n=1 Tax=hydrothermal vent metagenome TaxID=652676 RepID=A0A3B1DA95_9ZZZZ
MAKTNNMFSSIGDRTPLSQKVAIKIEEAILSKELSPGDKLPSEHELCEQFGVSRTSVREAVRILTTQGIVEVKKGRGIFVKNLSSQNVTDGILKFYQHRLGGEYAADLIHTRQALEPSIAYFAAKNRTEEDLELIEKNLRLIEKNHDNPEESAKYDIEFHDSLARASKNMLFVLMMRPLHKLIPPIKSKIHAELKGSTDVALLWHAKIYQAIKNKDAERARDAMIEHLRIAEEQIKSLYIPEN